MTESTYEVAFEDGLYRIDAYHETDVNPQQSTYFKVTHDGEETVVQYGNGRFWCTCSERTAMGADDCNHHQALRLWLIRVTT